MPHFADGVGATAPRKVSRLEYDLPAYNNFDYKEHPFAG